MIPGLVSVIIPTYNRPTYLAQAVESVFSQTYPFIEIIIIDDGSRDEGRSTKEALKPYLHGARPADLPTLTYLYQENSGVGPAVNRGVARAQGEYIQRLDDDDRLLPDKVARSVEVFQAKPEVGLVATGYYHIDSDGERLYTGRPNPCPGPARLLNMLRRCVSTCAAVMVRSRVHEKVGLYRDVRGQDYEMWIRIATEFDIETIDAPLVEYRLHSGNISRNNRIDVERDKIDFISEYLQSTPLDVLIPNLQVEPYGYALRASVYLLRDGEYIRTTSLARAELESARRMLPADPLVALWEAVLAIHEADHFPCLPLAGDTSLPTAYRAKAKELANLFDDRTRLAARKADPQSPEMEGFRRRFGTIRSALAQETFKKAIGKPG